MVLLLIFLAACEHDQIQEVINEPVMIEQEIIQEQTTAEIKQEESLPIKQEREKQKNIICSYDAYNCGDFFTHTQAQSVFIECGGVNNDVHRLDGDGDGSACESLP